MPFSGEAETIFALATAEGRSGVAVFRVSGPAAVTAAEDVCGSLGEERSMQRRALLAEDGSVIDDVLVVAFLEGRSFTGEDVVEIHSHGSIAVIRAISARLRGLNGLRDAQPGEFARRAFENGKLDLTQVEGLAELINAETEVQRRQAMSVYDGALSRDLATVKQALLRGSALCAANIDFADEEVPEDVSEDITRHLNSASLTIKSLLEGHVGAQRVANGIEIAIVGAPNVGKSTFLNALAGEEIAIVTDQAGTTRDVLECRLDIGGHLVRVLDTAGLRETTDPIEQEGVRRARLRAENADIRLFLYDGAEVEEDLRRPGDLTVLTKGDINARAGAISAKTGEGMDAFRDVLREQVSELSPQGTLIASQRQAALLQKAHGSIELADLRLRGGEGLEFAAFEIGSALRGIEEVVGRVGVEDVLGDVFSSFCIGK